MDFPLSPGLFVYLSTYLFGSVLQPTLSLSEEHEVVNYPVVTVFLMFIAKRFLRLCQVKGIA